MRGPSILDSALSPYHTLSLSAALLLPLRYFVLFCFALFLPRKGLVLAAGEDLELEILAAKWR